MLDGLKYFHFALSIEAQPGQRTDLLIADRSGEQYRRARDNSSLVSSLTELPQSDRVVLLLDGGRIADPVERNGAIQSVRQTLRVLVDNGAIGLRSRVGVVTTKIDLIAQSPDRSDVEKVLEAFRKRLAADFSERLLTLKFYDISARDPKRKYEPGHGLASLLTDWIATDGAPTLPVPPLPNLTNEFDRLLKRTPMEHLV